MPDMKGNDPNYNNTGSRKHPETPVSQFGSSETGGRRAVQQSMANMGKVQSPRKLQTTYCSNQKTDFRP